MSHTDQEIARQLRPARQRSQARFLWFDKQPVPNTGLGTLDEALWKPLLSAEGRVNPDTALEKMGLLGRDERDTVRATVAGLLFCSRAPEEWLPNACITATHYRGTDRASGQLDTQTITGPLDRQIGEAVAFAVRNMRVGAFKDPARMDLPQFSAEALFKTIANAVVHRDYSMRGSRIRLSMFAAAPGHAAHYEREWTPARGALAIALKPLPGGGGVIFAEDTGRVPGLQGQLNPIRDALDRTYLYASNIAIDQGRPQPVHFTPGEDLRLTDVNGHEMTVRIVEIVGRSALVEYRPNSKEQA